jgi:hypothetical protein
VVGETHPSAADWVDTIVASGSGYKRKCSTLAAKLKQPKSLTDQVTTQIELPPYHGSCRPSNLVAVKIIFGGFFEAFQHTS